MDVSLGMESIQPVYISWLKKNADRYRYLTKDALELKRRLLGCAEDSEEAKEMYVRFLGKFGNNPFQINETGDKRQGVEIISYDYRCYFIENEFGMYVPFELFNQLMPYRDEKSLAGVQKKIEDQLERDAAEAESARRSGAVTEKESVRHSGTVTEKVAAPTAGARAVTGETKTNQVRVRRLSVSVILMVISTCFILFILGVGFADLSEKSMTAVGRLVKSIPIAFAAFMAVLTVLELCTVRSRYRYEENKKHSFAERDGIQTFEKESYQIVLQKQELVRFVYLYTKAGAEVRELSDAELKGSLLKSTAGKGAKPSSEAVKKPPRSYIGAAAMAVLLVMAIIVPADVSKLGLPKAPEVPESVSTDRLTELRETEAEKKVFVTDDTQIAEWVITSSVCNVRKTPGGDVIGQLKRGEKVKVTDWKDDGEDGDKNAWGYAEAESGVKGYISRRVMRPVRKEQITIAKAEASSELKTKSGEVKSAQNAVDGSLLTSWQEGVAGFGEGESLTLTLKKDAEVSHIVLYNGNIGSESSYFQNGRASLITLEFDKGVTIDWEIPDIYDLNGIWLSLDEPVITSQVRIVIEHVYEGTKYKDTCITDIAVFR